MSRPIRIGVDCDGVLSDLDGLIIEKLNTHVGEIKYTKEMRTLWSIEASLGIDRSVVLDIMNQPKFCESMSVLAGVKEGITLLSNIQNSEVFVVTSPLTSSKTWMYERMLWLENHLNIDHSHVIQTASKHVIDLDVLIDDKVSTIEKWCLERPHSLGVVWQQCYNENDHRPIESLMTNNWSVVKDEIIRRFSKL